VIEEQETVVELQGSLSLRQAEEVRQRLGQALEAGQAVALDVRELTEVDISILQLIVAARVSAMHRGIELRLVKAEKGAFDEALEGFGLLESRS
jgi:anti-anti-sigma regulatory factor